MVLGQARAALASLQRAGHLERQCVGGDPGATGAVEIA